MVTAAVTYHRVSTLDQDPTLARAELRAAAARRGFEIVEEIEETGSGARGDRPGLARALELARRGKVAVILVWKICRFSRSMVDTVTLARELESCGVRLVSVTEGLEYSGPMGRLVLAVSSAFAEMELERTKERAALGRAAARAKGKHLGRFKGSTDAKPRKRRWYKRPREGAPL